ncbi:MAG: BtpA/SgcQ family protein [Clostridium fessum]
MRAFAGDPLYEKDATMGEVIEKADQRASGAPGGGVDGILIANEFSLPYEKRFPT